MVGSLSAGLLLADEAGAHLPSVDDFLPPEILFQGTPFAINRIILIRIVATIVLLVVLGVTAKRAKLIPGRWQGVVEYGLDFVRDKVVYDVMGEARGKRYVPMITTLFFTIFIFNLCGIIPGMNMAANATVVMPLVFAVWTLIQYWIAAIRSQGLGHYLRHELFTPGVPWPVYFLLAPINLLELLIIRPASLTIRLFANMVSGHLMVATCLAFAQFWMVDAVNKLQGIPVGALWFAGGFAMTCFEAFVAFLQAYVFAILSTVYINLSFPEERRATNPPLPVPGLGKSQTDQTPRFITSPSTLERKHNGYHHPRRGRRQPVRHRLRYRYSWPWHWSGHPLRQGHGIHRSSA